MIVLLDLPHEILLHISHFLSPHSAASFTYSCRGVRNTLGTEYWQAIQQPKQKHELKLFLQLLETDIHDHVLCPHCVILHPIEGFNHTSKECYPSELFAGVYIYIHPEINFLSLASLMKLYRQNLDYTWYLQRLTSEITTTRENMPYQFLSRARIVDGSLLLRVQESFFFPKGHPTLIPITARTGICHHVGIPGYTFEARLPEHMPCTLSHNHDRDSQQCLRSTGTRYCVYCPTEFQIELQGCGDLGISIVITKWLDLGEGRSVLDPKWWSRLSTKYTDHEIFKGMRGVYREDIENRLPVQSERASIRDDVESEEELLMERERRDEQARLMDPAMRIRTWKWMMAKFRANGQYYLGCEI